MPTCCGKSRDTRFCPDCGYQLIKHNVYSLLNYLKRSLETVRLTRERYVRDDPSSRKGKDTVAKWEAWVRELERLLAPGTSAAEAMVDLDAPDPFVLLPTRLASCLAASRITTLRELTQCTQHDLLGEAGFGGNSLVQLQDWLYVQGLHLSPDPLFRSNMLLTPSQKEASRESPRNPIAEQAADRRRKVNDHV